MKVGILGDAIDEQYAGIHFYTINLLSALLKIDHGNEYYIFRSKRGQEFTGARQIIVPIIRWLPGYQTLRHFVFFPYIARKYHLDVVVEPSHFGPFNLPSSIKRLTIIHDLTPILFPFWHSKRMVLLQKIFLHRIIRKADLIVTNSEYTKQDILKYQDIPSKKVIPIHLGISSIFYPSKNPHILGLHGIYKPYILFIGTLEPRKNLVRLMKAFAKFKETNPKAQEQLILVGQKGWKYQRLLKEKYNNPYKDDIILAGYVKREYLPYLYSSATMFIYPSLYEGFGMPILEAMACGTRVVTSNRTSMPEVGRHFTLYLDPENIEDMAVVIQKAYERPYVHRGEAVRYAHEFTWERTAYQFKVVLEKLHYLKNG